MTNFEDNCIENFVYIFNAYRLQNCVVYTVCLKPIDDVYLLYAQIVKVLVIH